MDAAQHESAALVPLVVKEQPKGCPRAPPSRRPSFDFGTSFEASFLAEQCSAATSQGTCPLPEDLFPDVTDSDNGPSFDFGREQQGGALSASTGSDAFTMQSLSTNGSSSDDLDELLTWLDKDVPLLGFRSSDVGPSPVRFCAAAAEQQEVTSPVPRSREAAPQQRPRFADPPPRAKAPVPLLRIRIKSQAWTRPVIVVADPPGAAFKKPLVSGVSFRTCPPAKRSRQASHSERSPSMEVNGLQSCGSTRSFGAPDLPPPGFRGLGVEAGVVVRKRRAGGRHARKEAWAERPLSEPILTNPVVSTFTSEGGTAPGGPGGDDEFASSSGRGIVEVCEAEMVGLDGAAPELDPEFVDNVSRRPGLRVVKRRVHVADEDGGGGETTSSPGRQAKWKRKAPRGPQGHRKFAFMPPAAASGGPLVSTALVVN